MINAAEEGTPNKGGDDTKRPKKPFVWRLESNCPTADAKQK